MLQCLSCDLVLWVQLGQCELKIDIHIQTQSHYLCSSSLENHFLLPCRLSDDDTENGMVSFSLIAFFPGTTTCAHPFQERKELRKVMQIGSTCEQLQYGVETFSFILSIFVKVPAVGGASWVTRLLRRVCNHSGILLDEHKRDDVQTTNKPTNHSHTVCSGIIPSMFWNITVMLVERNRHAGRSKPAGKFMTASAAVATLREWQMQAPRSRTLGDRLTLACICFSACRSWVSLQALQVQHVQAQWPMNRRFKEEGGCACVCFLRRQTG